MKDKPRPFRTADDFHILNLARVSLMVEHGVWALQTTQKMIEYPITVVAPMRGLLRSQGPTNLNSCIKLATDYSDQLYASMAEEKDFFADTIFGLAIQKLLHLKAEAIPPL
ncbi:hypothetical protein J6590_001217 [Homalodisca vitripennis]|nr:hypothetical protein J6590_001217 [Homalodisca vitripennis]